MKPFTYVTNATTTFPKAIQDQPNFDTTFYGHHLFGHCQMRKYNQYMVQNFGNLYAQKYEDGGYIQ